ncbi:MAG: TerB N-terminal domain-containing protein [Chloroflexota bacterium]
MFKDQFRQIANKPDEIIGGVNFQVRVYRADIHIIFATFKNTKPAQLAEFIRCYPQFAGLTDILFPAQVQQPVPLSRLAKVLQLLSSTVPSNALMIAVEPEIANLQKVEPPLNFGINYVWSKISGRLERHIALEADYVGEGWFLKGVRYWQVPQITAKDDQWLRRDRIEGQAVIDFLMHVKPNWQQRKLPFYISLTFSNAAILSINIEKVTEAELCLKVAWLAPVSQIEMGPFVDGYVIFTNTVRPGVHPQELGLKKLKESGIVYLRGEEIARFRDVAWSLVKPWATGHVRQFETQYPAVDKAKTALFTVGRSEPAKALPIPPKQTAVLTSSTVSRSPTSVPAFSTREKTFIHWAKKLENYHGKQASFVPFQQYWPQYTDMTKEQGKWYFYWRAQVRKQRYLNTDLSYIFVHIYELLNQIGVRDSLDGYQQLCRLWQNYHHHRYPQLNRYLLDWIADYAIVYQCPVKFLQIYVKALQEQVNLHNGIEIAVNHHASMSFLEMPFWILEKLIDYQVQHSGFYRSGNQELLETCIPQVLDHVNHRLQQRTGQTIWERFHPQQHQTIRRQPFAGAIYAGVTDEITVAVLVPYHKYQPLRDFLTGVVKYTENKLRELRGFNGRLQPPSLDPSVATFIDAFIANITDIIVPPPPKPQITIDLAEVTRLEDDATALFQLLHVPEEEPIPTLHAPSDITEPGTPIIPAADTTQSALPAPQPTNNATAPLGIEQKPANSHVVAAETIPASIVTPNIQNAPSPPVPPADGVKSSSTPLMIDPSELLRLEQESSGLFQLLHIPEEEPASSPVTIQPLADNIIPEESAPNHHLPPDWLEFTYRLAEYQRAVLIAILEETDPRETINKIANMQVTMPAPLLDAINELADETIGDILIKAHTIPTISDESYIEWLQQAVVIRQ